MTNPLDVQLRDSAALEEIELTSDLMIAASESKERLLPAQVDRILGIA